MILCRFRSSSPSDPFSGRPHTQRWVLEAMRNGTSYLLGLSRQALQDDGVWSTMLLPYIYLRLDPTWAIGRSHSFWNGPHDSFGLGFLRIDWSLGWCDDCFHGSGAHGATEGVPT